MGRAERQRARLLKREFFHDLVGLVRSARAAARRLQPGLAIQLLSAACYELGMARERYGANAATEWLRRAILRQEHLVARAFDLDPVDTSTRIAIALFRASLGARRGPKRSPLRLLATSAKDVAS